MRGRNEPVEGMLGRARAAMSRPVGVRAESEAEVLMRLAASRALEDIILEILVMVCAITWGMEVKMKLSFRISRGNLLATGVTDLPSCSRMVEHFADFGLDALAKYPPSFKLVTQTEISDLHKTFGATISSLGAIMTFGNPLFRVSSHV